MITAALAASSSTTKTCSPKASSISKGTKHKIGGLTFAPDKTLWAFSQLTPSIAEISPDGVQKPMRTFSDRKLSSVTFGKDGSL